MPLANPQLCRVCQRKGQVIDSRVSLGGYRRRRHRCPFCTHRWTTYESFINPRRVVLRHVRP